MHTAACGVMHKGKRCRATNVGTSHAMSTSVPLAVITTDRATYTTPTHKLKEKGIRRAGTAHQTPHREMLA